MRPVRLYSIQELSPYTTVAFLDFWPRAILTTEEYCGRIPLGTPGGPNVPHLHGISPKLENFPQFWMTKHSRYL